MTQCTMCQCVQLLHMIDTDYSLYSTCIYISFRFKSVILGVYRPLFHYISRPNPPHSAYPPWLITVSLTSHFSHEIANPIFPPLEFGAPVPCSSIPSVSQCLYVIKTNYITWMFRSVDSSANHRCTIFSYVKLILERLLYRSWAQFVYASHEQWKLESSTPRESQRSGMVYHQRTPTTMMYQRVLYDMMYHTDLKFVETVGTGGPVKFFLAV